jgi:hypothetical protein
MPKGNPNPVQTEAFKLHAYKPKSPTYSKEPLAPKPTMVRLAQNITNAIDNLGANKTPWLRRVISQAAYTELLSGNSLGDIPTETLPDSKAEAQAIAVLPVVQAIEAVEIETPTKSPVISKDELLAIALKHSGRAKLPKAWIDFIEKMPVHSGLPSKTELEAIAKKCLRKSELPQAWINFIDEISDRLTNA